MFKILLSSLFIPFCCLSLIGFLWSGAALRASGSEKLEPPDWPMRSRLVHSIATEWRWRMTKEELMKTNSVQWFETGTVRQEKEKGEEIVLGSPVLGAGSTLYLFIYLFF